MRVFTSLAVLLVLLVAVGCGGDDDQGSERAATGAETAETATGTETAAEPRDDADSGSGGGSAGGGESGSDDGGAPSGSGGSEAERAEVTEVVLDFHRALRDGDGDQVCSMLAERTQQRIEQAIENQPQFEGRTCADLIEMFAKNYPAQMKKALGSVDVRKVTIEGDRASVAYKVGSLPANTMPLERADGGWRVVAFAGAG